MCQRTKYQLRRGVDVSMYNTLLSPEVALSLEAEHLSDQQEAELWKHFSIDAYRLKVLELALPLLEKQLARLPREMKAALIPGSLSIYSPHDYSYGNDELHFSIEAQSALSEEEMQRLLDNLVQEDWNAEFGSQYRIYEKLAENYTVADFDMQREAI